MLEFCPLCEKNGTKKKIQLLQINFQDAVWMCESQECVWPFGYEDFTFVSRKVGKSWSPSSVVRKPAIQKSKESLPISSELSLYTPPVTPSGESLPKESVTSENTYSSFNPSLSSRSNIRIEGVSNLPDCNGRLKNSCTVDSVSFSDVTSLCSYKDGTSVQNRKESNGDAQPCDSIKKSSNALERTDLPSKNPSIFNSSDDEYMDSSAKSVVPSESNKTAKYSCNSSDKATIVNVTLKNSIKEVSEFDVRCERIEGLIDSSCQESTFECDVFLGTTNEISAGSSEHETCSVPNRETAAETESSVPSYDDLASESAFSEDSYCVSYLKNVPIAGNIERTHASIVNDGVQTCSSSRSVETSDLPFRIASDVESAKNSDQRDVLTTDTSTSESLANSISNSLSICNGNEDPFGKNCRKSIVECSISLGIKDERSRLFNGSSEHKTRAANMETAAEIESSVSSESTFVRDSCSASNLKSVPATVNIEKTNANIVNDSDQLVRTCPSSSRSARSSDLPFRMTSDIEFAENSHQRTVPVTNISTSETLRNSTRTSNLKTVLSSSQANIKIPNSALNDKLNEYEKRVLSVPQPLNNRTSNDNTSASSTSEPRMEITTMKVDGLPPIILSYEVPKYLSESTSADSTKNESDPGNSKGTIDMNHSYFDTRQNDKSQISDTKTRRYTRKTSNSQFPKQSRQSVAESVKSSSALGFEKAQPNGVQSTNLLEKLPVQNHQSVIEKKKAESVGSSSALGFGRAQSNEAQSTQLLEEFTLQSHQSIAEKKKPESVRSSSALGFGRTHSDKAQSTSSPKKSTKRSYKGRKYEGFSFSEIRKKTKLLQSDGESNNLSSPSPGNASICSDVTNVSELSHFTHMSERTMDSNYSLNSNELDHSPTKESDVSLTTDNVSISAADIPDIGAALDANINLDSAIDEFLENDSHNVSRHINDDWLMSLLS